MKSMVVAYGQNREIGGNNDLLWRLPADLRHFRELTTGKSIIMGRKTFESIGRVLPNRQNIVVSRGEVPIDGVAVAHDLPSAYAAADKEIFIIGGGTIYEQALPDADVAYATEVKATFPEATVFFPPLGPQWREISREPHQADADNPYDYDFVEYRKA